MTNEQRLQIFPTRMNLSIIKNRLKSAEKGHSLLKRKSDAIQRRYKELQIQLAGKRKEIEQKMTDAFLSFNEAEFAGANFKMYLHECKKNPFRVKTTFEQISGITLPFFAPVYQDKPVFCLERSGIKLKKCRQKFLIALQLLIEVSSIENSFIILETVLKSVNRRVNALEFLLIPRLENTVQYINSELDEQDREEFYRLKKIQGLKKE